MELLEESLGLVSVVRTWKKILILQKANANLVEVLKLMAIEQRVICI